jgi:hypothetical protein
MNRYANEMFAQLVPGGLGEQVRPLTLMSTEGLEMALPYLAAGDFTWPALFETRFSGGEVDVRSMYQAIYDWRATNNVPRRVNDYLKARFDRIFETVTRRYRGDADGEA